MKLKILLKVLFSIPLMKCTRKCGFSGSTLVAVVFLVIFGLYMSTSHDSISNEKPPPSLEIFNDTVYTETPIVVNTETTNVMIRKQLTNHIYERPLLVNESVGTLHSVQFGEVVPNCGLPRECDKNEFSVHLYTGKDNKDEPRLCVDGKYIISKDINIGGRGMNVAVIDNMTRTIIRVGHFDTYEKESTVLETLLLTLRQGDIVILITFDEPTRKLSRIARLLLFDLGSGLIQNLGYRGSWYLITQKGLSGFAPYEDLHMVENNGWPKKHDVRFCVPFKIKGKSIHPDPLPSSNPPRVAFCEKHGELPLFCDADVVNDPLLPAPVWKQPAAINKIYNVPIIVMSGDNVQFLPLTLETLVRQPGMRPSLVVVFHLTKNAMVRNLAELFGFISEELSETSNYCDRVAEAFEMIFLLYPDAKEFIYIGENAILAPDFLFFMGQLISILKMDPSLLTVSALNENGFKSLSGDPTLAYRVESFSSLAILVRKDFFKRAWCRNESLIDPMYISSDIQGASLVPDVSRVTLAAPMSYVNSSQNISSFHLTHDRTITYEQNILLKPPERLFLEDYEREIEKLLSSTAILEFDTDSLRQCLKEKENFQVRILEDLPLFISNTTNLSNRLLSIFYYQEDENDIRTLLHLCHCFGLFHHPLYPVRGLYKGLLRFMLKDNQAALVGSKSPFFRFRSEHTPVLKFDEHLGSLVNIVLHPNQH